MSWNKQKTLELIKEYEKRPILWNKEHSNYYNMIPREEAWLEISVILNEDERTVKQKIINLRNKRSKKKIRMLKGIEKGRENNYKTTWFAWESLKFLNESDEIQHTLLPNCQVSENEEDSDVHVNSEPIKEEGDVIGVPQNNSSPPKKTFLSPNQTALNLKRKRRNSRFQEGYNIKKTSPEKDECAMFGEFIVEKLRKLENRTRSILEYKIHDLIFKAEMIE